MSESDRHIKHGVHLFQLATSLGWTDGEDEGPIEFVMRRTREVALEDAQKVAKLDRLSLTARVKELEGALSGVLWMAEEWFEHGGDETTLADDYEKQLEAARAALTPQQGGE